MRRDRDDVVEDDSRPKWYPEPASPEAQTLRGGPLSLRTIVARSEDAFREDGSKLFEIGVFYTSDEEGSCTYEGPVYAWDGESAVRVAERLHAVAMIDLSGSTDAEPTEVRHRKPSVERIRELLEEHGQRNVRTLPDGTVVVRAFVETAG